MNEYKRKNSIKRKAILDALYSTNDHPTAEMIYERLKSEYPDLSLGTVYRNLSMFCKDGSAKSLGKLGGKERFDGRTDPHSHFVCRECGCVADVDVPMDGIESAMRIINTDYGFTADNFSLYFSGLCKKCAECFANN